MNASALRDADRAALERVRRVRPQCVAVRRVSDVLPGVGHTVFHAGPGYSSPSQIPVPVLNSMAQACVFEGWHGHVDDAGEAIRSGAVRTCAAQGQRLLVPLAGVLTASMAVLEIADASGSVPPVFAALNEGALHATRLGRIDPGLLAHLQWLNGPFASWLAGALAEPLPLLPHLAKAREEGDDGHALTQAGSRRLAAASLGRAPTDDAGIRAFLETSAAFALNFWMGAASLAARAAEGVAGASLVTHAGGNGVDFAIQLAGLPGRWFRQAAPVPTGTVEAAWRGRVPVGALGDSAVVDFAGLGGQSLDTAPGVRAGLAAVLPADWPSRAAAVLEQDSPLRVTSARRCAQAGVGPLVLLGMIDSAGEAGRIGGGVVDVPAALFARALAALDLKEAA